MDWKSKLSDIFVGVAAKRLTSVEVDINTSNQHEFAGINRFREFIGNEKQTFQAIFCYLSDDMNEPASANGEVTWYDTRSNQPNRSEEFRLYFPSTNVSGMYQPGDLLIIGLLKDGRLAVVVAESGSSVAGQFLWMFGLDDPEDRYLIKANDELDKATDYMVRRILELIGIELDPTDSDLDILLSEFGESFPTTREFSEFARNKCVEVDPISDPDNAILSWLDTEERLFRTLEKHLISTKLQEGFVIPGDVDVDGFIRFSLSVQNRRKSRAGHAVENHLERIFKMHELSYVRGAYTERKSKPDFLFPSREAYLDQAFPCRNLAILGAKASCKDRWRQILTEADRLQNKHLMTLEPGISEDQTTEMQSKMVNLVVPHSIHSSYTDVQQQWLWSLSDFICHIKNIQDMK